MTAFPEPARLWQYLPMLLMSLWIGAAAHVAVIERHDTWTYGEASNYCMAFFNQGTSRLVIRFSAKTDDDSIMLWQKRLPSLTKGLNNSEKAAAAGRNYDLQLNVGDRRISLTPGTRDLRPKNMSGNVYVLGVDERSFIEALAKGPSLEIQHRGSMIASYNVADNATLASRLSVCVDAL